MCSRRQAAHLRHRLDEVARPRDRGRPHLRLRPTARPPARAVSAVRGRAAGTGAPLSRKPSRSRFVTRPAMPLPVSCGDLDAVLGGDAADERRAPRADALLEAAAGARRGGRRPAGAATIGPAAAARSAEAAPPARPVRPARRRQAPRPAPAPRAPFSVSRRATTVCTAPSCPRRRGSRRARRPSATGSPRPPCRWRSRRSARRASPRRRPSSASARRFPRRSTRPSGA